MNLLKDESIKIWMRGMNRSRWWRSRILLFDLLDNVSNTHFHIWVTAKNLFVNLHQAKEFQTPHCYEKLRLASWKSMKLEETYVIPIRTVHLLTLIWSLATHLHRKYLGTNQVCNLPFHFPHDRSACSLGIDWSNYQPLQSFIASLASLCYWHCRSICCL